MLKSFVTTKGAWDDGSVRLTTSGVIAVVIVIIALLVVAVIGRYIFACISGVIFFGAYAPEGMNPLVYSLGYNASYLVPEAIVTLILVSLPPVAKALVYVKRQAVAD